MGVCKWERGSVWLGVGEWGSVWLRVKECVAGVGECVADSGGVCGREWGSV